MEDSRTFSRRFMSRKGGNWSSKKLESGRWNMQEKKGIFL
jgi:hypothetical protein